MDLYLDTLLKRYKAANRKGKSAILNELCEASGYHKKHAIRLLNQRKVRLNQRKVHLNQRNVHLNLNLKNVRLNQRKVHLNPKNVRLNQRKVHLNPKNVLKLNYPYNFSLYH